MTKFQLLGALAAVAAIASAAQAGPPGRTSVAIGLNFGSPGPYYRPYYAPYYGPYYGPYYRPYPYYYAPPAVIVQPAPQVIYQPAPVVVQQQPAVAAQPLDATQPQPVYSAPPQAAFQQTSRPNIDGLLANLRNTSEAVRRDSVMELGRMKAAHAIQPLTATLAGDQSPVVREAAARALGLISSPSSLVALQHAAQADPDRDVRHSAQFAVDIIKTTPR